MRDRVSRRWWLRAGIVLAGLAARPGWAGASQAEVSSADAKRVRKVIEAQLAAFAAEDGPRAFSFAAPNIRELFGDADHFMAMVKSSYPVILRPASVAFLKPRRLEAELIQGVDLTDQDDQTWLAVYHLQRVPRQGWRISACELAQSQGRFA